jgi:hypothetical protein
MVSIEIVRANHGNVGWVEERRQGSGFKREKPNIIDGFVGLSDSKTQQSCLTLVYGNVRYFVATIVDLSGAEDPVLC